MLKRRLLSLLLLFAQLAFAETPAQANKRLFDKTVDELNFRTFETVYDKSFTRGKFPLTLRTAAARKSFDGFGDNRGLRQLFMNYNGIAERYKSRFGNGPMTLAEFEKQLNSILLDKNFEFFIHNLPRDERVALIRAEQRLIKQAAAQFNDSGNPEDMAAVPADVDAEIPTAAPLTTHDNAAAAVADDNTEPPLATPVSSPAPRRDWLDYFTLLLGMANFLMLLYLITNLLPTLSRRVNNLAYEPEPEPEPRSFISRLRSPRSSSGLRDDTYDDEEEQDDATPPRSDDAYAPDHHERHDR